jgi:hypothetical protein
VAKRNTDVPQVKRIEFANRTAPPHHTPSGGHNRYGVRWAALLPCRCAE